MNRLLFPVGGRVDLTLTVTRTWHWKGRALWCRAETPEGDVVVFKTRSRKARPGAVVTGNWEIIGHGTRLKHTTVGGLRHGKWRQSTSC